MDLTGIGADNDDGGRLVAVTDCPCGAVHRLGGEAVDAYRDVVAGLPPVIPIQVGGSGAWRVPRLYIAMHGLKAAELAGLAEQYGWPAAVPWDFPDADVLGDIRQIERNDRERTSRPFGDDG